MNNPICPIETEIRSVKSETFVSTAMKCIYSAGHPFVQTYSILTVDIEQDNQIENLKKFY